MQIVENWSELRGQVEAAEQTQSNGTATVLLRLRVLTVAPVEGFRNLLADAAGKTLALRGSALPRLPKVGETVRCRVRKAGPERHFYAAESLIIE